MRINARQAIGGLFIAGIAGGFLALPALSLIGSLLLPVAPTPVPDHIPSLLQDAIWAHALGGRATQLEPINPFSVGRMASCHAIAELTNDAADLEREHDECFKLMPGLQAVGYLANVHMQSQGIWQDIRVPFVAIATMTKVSSTWTRAELIDTLGARGEFGRGFVGVDQAAHGYFAKVPSALTLQQAALLASTIGDRRSDPWCNPVRAAERRRRVLEGMRANQVIDDAQFTAASQSSLDLAPPPTTHKACDD